MNYEEEIIRCIFKKYTIDDCEYISCKGKGAIPPCTPKWLYKYDNPKEEIKIIENYVLKEYQHKTHYKSMELDGWCDKNKFGFEYDGPIHYLMSFLNLKSYNDYINKINNKKIKKHIMKEKKNNSLYHDYKEKITCGEGSLPNKKAITKLNPNAKIFEMNTGVYQIIFIPYLIFKLHESIDKTDTNDDNFLNRYIRCRLSDNNMAKKEFVINKDDKKYIMDIEEKIYIMNMDRNSVMFICYDSIYKYYIELFKVYYSMIMITKELFPERDIAEIILIDLRYIFHINTTYINSSELLQYYKYVNSIKNNFESIICNKVMYYMDALNADFKK